MGATFRGTFVISWSQTEVDGLKAATLQALTTGSVWSWRGEAVRVDGPHGVLSL
ncbi:MAG: hemolysin-type calcium-binding protein, partial [Paracoccaceae bacterium]|nr:hemolysin-type calcium-binding protein [Paracoccaceae bacterium]